jgi:serine/threonine protein kinase
MLWDAVKSYINSIKGKRDAFVKILFTAKEENRDEIERAIYRYLSILYKLNITPNIMRFIASFQCNNLRKQLLSENPQSLLAKKMLKLIQDIKTEDDGYPINPSKPTTFLVLELGEGKVLNKIIEELSLSNVKGQIPLDNAKAIIRDILFQIYYTLHQMSILRVRHNDLHTENVWINKSSDLKRMIYFVDEKNYVIIETSYVVRIYDFDLGAFTSGVIPNIALDVGDMCASFGMCSNDNFLFDIHTILSYLIAMSVKTPSPVTAYLKQLADIIIVDADYKDEKKCCRFFGRMCGPVPRPPLLPSRHPGGEPRPRRCEKNFIPPPGAILTFMETFNTTNIFDDIKFKLSNGFNKNDLPLTALPQDIGLVEPYKDFKTNLYVSLDVVGGDSEQAIRRNVVDFALRLSDKFS